MSIPRTVAWGVALAASTALISGVSVFVNGLIVKEFADPVALTGARNALVGLALVAILVASGGVAEVRTLRGPRAAGVLALALIGGSIPFILFFSGLAAAGGPGAAIIHKTMFVWVAVLAVPFLGERLGAAQVAAIGLLLAGTLLVGPTGALGLGGGELAILAATGLWSIEIVVARRLLRDSGVGVAVAAAARMALGALVILGFLVMTGRIGAIAAFDGRQWLLIAGTGLLLLGYVTTWYGALQRAPAALVSAVLVGGAVITALLATIRTGTLPTPAVETGLGLLALGIVLAAWSGIRSRRSVAPAAVDAPST